MNTQFIFSNEKKSTPIQFGSQNLTFQTQLFASEKDLFASLSKHVPNEIEIVSANFNEASEFCKVKRWTEAMDCYKRSLDTISKIEKPGSEPGDDATICHDKDQMASLLDTLLSLAEMLEKKQFYNEAKDHYNQIVDLYNQSELEKDERLASVYTELGSILTTKSEFANALTNYTAALDIYTKLNKTDDADVSNVYEGMGSVCRYLEKGEECLKYLNMALDIRIRVFGSEDLSVAKIYDLFARYYLDVSEDKKAKEYYDMSLNIKLTKGCSSIELAESYIIFGLISSKDSKFEEALKYVNMALDIYLKEHLQVHPGIIEIYNHLAYIRHKQTRYNDALELCNTVESTISKLRLGPYHHQLASSYETRGLVYNAWKRESTLHYFEKCLDIRTCIFGTQHLSTANVYNSLGGYYHRINRSEEALNYFQLSLDVRIKKFGEDHISLAIIYNNMAVVHNGQGDVVKSLDFLKKSLSIKEKNYGKDHVETAKSQYNIGIAYRRLEDYRLSISFGRQALDTYIKVWGIYHIDVVKATYQLASNFYSVGNIKEAVKILKVGVVANERSPTKKTINMTEARLCFTALKDYSKEIDQFNIDIAII